MTAFYVLSELFTLAPRVLVGGAALVWFWQLADRAPLASRLGAAAVAVGVGGRLLFAVAYGAFLVVDGYAWMPAWVQNGFALGGIGFDSLMVLLFVAAAVVERVPVEEVE